MNAALVVHRAAVGTYLALFGLLLAWLLWLDPPPGALISAVALVLLTPLLLPIHGILTGRRYTLAWSTMLILLYFIHGVSAAAGPPPQRWLGLAEAGLSVIYFVLAIVFVRMTRHASPSGAGART